MIDAADLLLPKGPEDPVLFPDTEVVIITGYLEQYLANGYSDPRVDVLTDDNRKDALARAWALYQVFDGVATRMSAEPLSVNGGPEKGSTGYSTAQIANIQAKADRYLAEFLGLLTAPLGATVQASTGTLAIQTDVQW